MLVLSFIKNTCDNASTFSILNAKISKYAGSLLNHIRFRTKDCTDTYNSNVLLDLKRILEDKLRGSDCYEQYDTKQIIQLIKKLSR
jgi:transposase-like protein